MTIWTGWTESQFSDPQTRQVEAANAVGAAVTGRQNFGFHTRPACPNRNREHETQIRTSLVLKREDWGRAALLSKFRNYG